MLVKKIKNQKLRLVFNKIEKSRKIYKFLFVYLLNAKINKSFSKALVKKKLYFFQKRKQLKILTRITRRCVITNRPRAVYRPLGIARSSMRELIQNGLVPGYTKGVW